MLPLIVCQRPISCDYTKYRDVMKLVEDLKSNTTPEAVRMYYASICGMSAAAIGDALADNTSLKWLQLCSCDLDNEGGTAIGRALGANSALGGLIIEPSTYIGSESMQMISEGIIQSKFFKDLSLIWCNIGEAGAMSVGRVLLASQTLERLQMTGTRIGNEGARLIAEGVAGNRRLRYIDLNNCEIGREGAIAMGRALGESQSLQALWMTQNHIGSEGARGIAEGTAKSRCLNKLFLGFCNIGREGAMALGKALGRSQTLESLWIDGNLIGANGLAGISEGVARSKSLTHLSISKRNISERGWLPLLLAIKLSNNCETFSLYQRDDHFVGCIWEELDLPPEAFLWRFKDLFLHWANERRGKMTAFAMLMHARLGEGRGSQPVKAKQKFGVVGWLVVWLAGWLARMGLVSCKRERERACCFRELDDDVLRMIATAVLGR